MSDEPIETSEADDADDPSVAASAAASETTYVVVLWEPLSSADTVMHWGPPQMLERDLRSVVTTPKEANTIDVWLQSGGGSADEAYRYMLLFREYASRVRVIVGAHAKSAATLMLLGADSIFMGPTSELGPLDAQIWIDEEDRRTSALDIARSVEHLASMALDLALSSGGVVHGITGIPRRQVLPAVLDFSANFVEPIVSKLDPSAIHRASNQLEVAREYGQRLLGMRADPMPASTASALTYHLVNDYPDHNFIISRGEATDIGLPVEPLLDYELVATFEDMIDTFEGDDALTVIAFELADAPQGEDPADVEEPGDTLEDHPGGGGAVLSPSDGAQLVAIPGKQHSDADDDKHHQPQDAQG